MVRTAGIMKIQKPGSLNTLLCPSVGHRHCPVSIVRRPLTAEWLAPKDSFHLHVDRHPCHCPSNLLTRPPNRIGFGLTFLHRSPFFLKDVITLKYPVIIRHYCLHILQASRVPLSTISPPQRVLRSYTQPSDDYWAPFRQDTDFTL